MKWEDPVPLIEELLQTMSLPKRAQKALRGAAHELKELRKQATLLQKRNTALLTQLRSLEVRTGGKRDCRQGETGPVVVSARALQRARMLNCGELDALATELHMDEQELARIEAGELPVPDDVRDLYAERFRIGN